MRLYWALLLATLVDGLTIMFTFALVILSGLYMYAWDIPVEIIAFSGLFFLLLVPWAIYDRLKIDQMINGIVTGIASPLEKQITVENGKTLTWVYAVTVGLGATIILTLGLTGLIAVFFQTRLNISFQTIIAIELLLGLPVSLGMGSLAKRRAAHYFNVEEQVIKAPDDFDDRIRQSLERDIQLPS